MSQKVGRRSKKTASIEETTTTEQQEFKQPTPTKNGAEENKPNEIIIEENVTNGTNVSEDGTEINKHHTRSRSRTPLKKKKIEVEEDLNKNGEQQEQPQPPSQQLNDVIEIDENNEENNVHHDDEVIEIIEDKENGIGEGHEERNAEDVGEMDSLLLDEPDPESQQPDNDEPEQSKNDREESPMIVNPSIDRCLTRKSQNRNIPTPKSNGDEQSPDVNDVSYGTDNLSTRAEVGSDSTRLDFVEQEQENSFLNISKNKSFTETLKGLTSRPSIRPISTDYRKTVLSKSINKSDLNNTYPMRHSVERLSIGRKRKASTESSDDGKRFKNDGDNGFFARLTYPLNSLRRLRTSTTITTASSTPTLTAYKDEHFLVANKGKIKDTDKRNWCSIM